MTVIVPMMQCHVLESSRKAHSVGLLIVVLEI